MGSASQQGVIWGARAQDWTEANEPAWHQVFETVMDRMRVGPGREVLDVGCGAGGALAVARERGAIVTGLDASEALVGIARGRLPGAEIQVGDMEELPFPDQSFDLVTGLNSFQFAGSPVNALREARRVVRPGGAVAMMVWGPRQDCDMLSKVMPAIVAFLPPSAATPSPPLAQPGVIEGLMEQAGLSPQDGFEFASDLEFPDLATAATAILAASARAIAHSGETRVRAGIEEALSPLVRADGKVRLRNRFRLVLGERR
jgi:SAM-dependent methyltransferase